jgi:hypothetical protein
MQNTMQQMKSMEKITINAMAHPARAAGLP